MATSATSVSSSATPAGTRLHGNLHVWDVIFMVVATSAPLTVIVAVYPIGFTIGNGVGFPTMYLLMGILLLFFSVGFTTMTRHVPNPGAFFTYVAHGLGRPLGLAAAYTAVLCYACLELAVVAYIGYDVSNTVATYTGLHIHWLVFSAIAWVTIGYLGFRHIELSAKVLGILLTVEIVLSLLVSFVAVSAGGAHGLDIKSFTPSEIVSGAPALGLMFAVASFLGFESTAIYRDEARTPETTIPRATYGAVILLGIFYTFTCWAFVMAWGSGGVVHAATTDPDFLFTTTRMELGSAGDVVAHIFVITSIFAVCVAFHNVTTRYAHALAGVHAFPAYLSKLGHKDGAPVAASLTTSIVIGLFVLVTFFTGLKPYANTFTWFVGLGTLAYLLLLAGCSVAVLGYFAVDAARRKGESAWTVIVCPLVAACGLGVVDYITITNFPLLIGDVDAKGNPVFGGLSAALLILFAAFFLAGIVQAVFLRARNREAYREITEAGVGL